MVTKEKIKEYKKKYRDKNREELNRKSREYTKKFPEIRRLAKVKWARKNRLHKSVLNRNWNAKQLGAIGSFTTKEYKDKLDFYNNKCGYCLERNPYTIDHIIPISKGGNNYIDNIMPACLQCNGQKRDYLLEEWFLLPNCYNKNKHLLDKPTN